MKNKNRSGSRGAQQASAESRPFFNEPGPDTVDPIWFSRKDVVLGMIKHTSDVIEDAITNRYAAPMNVPKSESVARREMDFLDPVSDVPRLLTLFRALLTGLRAYVTDNFDYFSKFPLKDMPFGYRRELALRVTLEQAQRDLNLIQQIALQRVVGSNRSKMTLQKSDALAEEALQPAIDAGLFEANAKPAVLTYFQKAAQIRTVPYVKVAFVGIPYSCAEIDNRGLDCRLDQTVRTGGGLALRDYLAIPHEIGHFVYWWGLNSSSDTVTGARLYIHNAIEKVIGDEHPNFQPWAKRWIEECFADWYGTMVAGPASAVMTARMAAAKSRIELLTDDGEHPIAAVRPSIATSALLGTKKYSLWAKEIDQWWARRRDNFRLPRNFASYQKTDSKRGRVGFTEAEFELKKIVQIIADQLAAVSNVLDSEGYTNSWRPSLLGRREPSRKPDGPDVQYQSQEDLLNEFEMTVSSYEIAGTTKENSTQYENLGRSYQETQAEIVQQEQIVNPVMAGDPEATRLSEWWARLRANGWLEDDGPGDGPKYP